MSNPLFPSNPQAFLTRFSNLPVLSVKRKEWRMEQTEHERNEADMAFQQVRKQVLERDGRRCCICGFTSTVYQEVHHLDDNHNNNSLDNLITICNVCHLCFHIGLAAMRGAIFLAVVPELTQAEITNLMRLYHCAMRSGNAETVERLEGLYAIFESRSVEVFKRAFEADFSKGHEIAEALSKMEEAKFAMRGKALSNLRVIPTKEAFREEQIISYMTRTHTEYFGGKHWPHLLDTLTGKTA